MTTREWTGQRVLVTGAGGFIGRHLCRRLEREGAEVLGITRQVCDLTDEVAVRRTVREADPDVVLHLAAARAKGTAAERAATMTVNTCSGAWIVESVSQRCRCIVRLGSSTEYAESAVPMDESTPLRPRGFFGATKAAGSLAMTASAAERGLRAHVTRAFQVYGPGDKPDRFVPVVMEAARSAQELALTAPRRRRDWVYVDDVVDACLRIAARDDLPSTTYNIGTGVQTTNEQLVATAESVTGRPISTILGAHPGRGWDTDNWVCDPTAARRELGWEPRFDLAAGLARCWEAA